MRKVLIVYGSTEGQTAKIADELVETFTTAGWMADSFHGESLPAGLDLAAYNAVIVGASIHMGKYQSYMTHFVQQNVDCLQDRPSAFFSVSLSAAGDTADERAEVQGYLNQFMDATGWQPDLVGSFGGALRYTGYGFLKRFIMRRIAKQTGKPTDTSQDYEFTDWASVEEFAQGLLALGEKTAPKTVSA